MPCPGRQQAGRGRRQACGPVLIVRAGEIIAAAGKQASDNRVHGHGEQQPRDQGQSCLFGQAGADPPQATLTMSRRPHLKS